MHHTLTIAKRELSSLFYSPVAYLVLAVFAFVSSGLFAAQTFFPGAPAEMRLLFQWMVWLLVFLVPAISMRLISEELRSGTIETLMTSPIKDMHVVLGKWLGGLAFYLILLSPLVVHVLVLSFTARPGLDYGPVATGFMGLVLVGGLYLAIGLALSATTDSQLIAFMLTVLAVGMLSIGMALLATQIQGMPLPLQQALHYANVHRQFEDFSKGLIDTSNFVYFVSGIGLFLFLAVLILQSKRWR